MHVVALMMITLFISMSVMGALAGRFTVLGVQSCLSLAGDLILTILMGVIVLIVLLRGMKDIRDALTAPARLVR